MEQAMYTVDEFCSTHRISRSRLYQAWKENIGPRTVRIGTKVLISREAAADWRRGREAGASQPISAEVQGAAA